MNIGGTSSFGNWSRASLPTHQRGSSSGLSPAEQDSKGAANPSQSAAKTLGQAEGDRERGPVGRKEDCQTCEGRTYQDGSNDPGVSFKTPSKIQSGLEASAVMSHEREHVVRNQAKAQREGREVVNQSVTLHNGVCAECGRVYVSGGTTRTVTRSKQENPFAVGLQDGQEAGKRLNSAV